MKKLHVLFLFIMMVAVTVVSCDDEPLEGVFSVTGDGSDPIEVDSDSEECQIAFETLTAAQAAFSVASNEGYAQACTTYAIALEATIQLCGDASGTFQAALTSLGDCSTPDPCFQAEIAANAALGALNNASSDNEEQLCLAYSAALEAQIAACGDVSGNIQATIDALNCGGDCAAAQVATSEAREIFNAVDPLDEDAYTTACADYSMALQAQIAACGDTDGSLTAIVQNLGDCSPPEQDGPVQVTVGEIFTNFNTATVSISGSLLSVIATDIDTGDTFTFDIVLQQTGDNVMQNTILTVGGVVHTASIEATTPFVNNITANDGTAIVGTFSGTFTNPDNEEVLTAGGVINIVY
ncbi:hypothetical protein JM84_1408 [Dokdonia sp. Hel_I_63]|uniref:hypothetical protein n=1 Tax=unclassified Dokdonia TaxID=2615033 RepID=UPI00020A7BF0|nr:MULTISPECIES: hypothetical protein [unclassified Dokdonia]AEE18262.1 hypothetical protein Krodi_0275 [Dokdonia sp. 4H-3-7-5]TVZ22506.1 hypothetical protein JM84_1408 [Dokdonia sp. Hel_I_63]